MSLSDKKVIKMQCMQAYFVLGSTYVVLEQSKLNTINSVQKM